MKFSPLSWLFSGSRRRASSEKPAPRMASAPQPQPQWPGRRSDASAERSSPPGDAQLSRVAQAWLDGLPARLRPVQAAATYPRIVNRIALCWSDPELLAKVFSELLVDRRGGRRGFPPEVAAELLALRDVNVTLPQATPAPTRAWDLRTVATTDRDSRFDEGAIATRF